MTTISTLTRVELTRDEIETITSALHEEYKRLTELANAEETPQHKAAYSLDASAARRLRNDFAKIIGRSYMGADA